MKEDFALVIGINDYTPVDESGLKTLQGAINDANKMEEWLISSTGGKVPSANIYKVISDPNPLKPFQDEIDDAFLEMEKKIKSKGGLARRLYFYFAGHGLGTTDDTTNTALCLANWSENRRKSALSSELYKETIKQYGYFEEIIFIADCCRLMKINVNPKPPTFSPPMPSSIAGQTKLFVAYATQYDDAAHEVESIDSEMRGAFTKVLLEGLSGGAADDNGIINANTLFDYLTIQTPIEADNFGFKQKPEIAIFSFGNTPLLIIENFQEKVTLLNIIFKNNRNNTVDLIDGSNLDILHSYDASQTKTNTVSLKKGGYFLVDKVSGDKLRINVSPSNYKIDVEF
jgi:hypothetical protein